MVKAKGRKNTQTQIIPWMWLAEPGPISGPPKGESQAGHPGCTVMHTIALHWILQVGSFAPLILIFTARLASCNSLENVKV